MNETAQPKRWSAGAWVLWVILPLIVGSLLSLLIPRPAIGVIKLDDAIYSTSANDLITQLRYARDAREIRAVVLQINSPGGTVSDTEAVYAEIIRLRQVKPVVTYVQGMAASGAYYMSVATDYIITQPSSLVGHIGVISTLPTYPLILDDLYTTGPYKLTGSPRDKVVREIEASKQGFLQAVLLGRSQALKIDEATLLRAQVWTGLEAVQTGVIDEIGSVSQAYDKAASLAKISHYEVVDLRTLSGLPEVTFNPFFFQTEQGIITPYPNKAGIYMLYIPPVGRQP